MCKVNISSLSLPGIGGSVKINYGLCLLCALSFGRHLCCSEKLIRIIKANLSPFGGHSSSSSACHHMDTLH